MASHELQRLRREYESEGLTEADVAVDPLDQFRLWFDAARDSGLDEPNAFFLGTVDEDGSPSVRALLMKDLDDGVVFYTGLDSRKSRAMASNGLAAATFAWIPLHRQVRFEGSVERVSPEMCDEYFASRPRGAQIAAHASLQSSVTDREALDKRYEEIQDEYADKDVPRPAHWGGWRLIPQVVEFWQGQPNRFHDRLRYRLVDGSWIVERLAP